MNPCLSPCRVKFSRKEKRDRDRDSKMSGGRDGLFDLLIGSSAWFLLRKDES